jgi:hypothetical protein
MSAVTGIILVILGMYAIFPNPRVVPSLSAFFGGIAAIIIVSIITFLASAKHICFHTTFFLLLFVPSIVIVVPTKMITQYTSYIERKKNEQWMEIHNHVSGNIAEYRRLLEKVNNNTATDLEISVVKSLWRQHVPDEVISFIRRFMEDKYFLLNVLNSDLLDESIIREIYTVYAEKPYKDHHIFCTITSSTITPDDILSDISRQPGRFFYFSNVASQTLAKKTSRKYPDATTSNLIAAVRNKAVSEAHHVHAIKLSKNGMIPDAEIDLLVGEFLDDAEIILNMLSNGQIPPRLFRHVFDHYKTCLAPSSYNKYANGIITLIAKNPQTPADILNEILDKLGVFDRWPRAEVEHNLQCYPRHNRPNVP